MIYQASEVKAAKWTKTAVAYAEYMTENGSVCGHEKRLTCYVERDHQAGYPDVVS